MVSWTFRQRGRNDPHRQRDEVTKKTKAVDRVSVVGLDDSYLDCLTVLSATCQDIGIRLCAAAEAKGPNSFAVASVTRMLGMTFRLGEVELRTDPVA